jgi:hypothetical protein
VRTLFGQPENKSSSTIKAFATSPSVASPANRPKTNAWQL